MSRFLMIASVATMSLGLSAVGCGSSCPCTAGGQGKVAQTQPATQGSLTKGPQTIDGRKVYDVAYVPNAAIKIDGDLNEPAWAKAQALTDFCLPWTKGPVPRMGFKAICDDENLYFAFRVYGPFAPADTWEGKLTVLIEDCVELYLSCDDGMKEYYGLEIDSLGRVHDYKAAYHRRIDHAWSCPGLKTSGKGGKDGYVVEGSIPLATLAGLRMPLRKDGDKVLAALNRCQGPYGDVGPFRWRWASWVDPHTEEPDFHVPGMLGYLRLRR